VHGSESAGTGAGLELAAVLASLLGEGLAGGHNDDVGPGKLLLELADELGVHLAELGEKAVRDREDHGALAATDLDLLGTGNVELAHLDADIVGTHLQLEESVSDLGLERVGLGTNLLLDLASSRKGHLEKR